MSKQQMTYILVKNMCFKNYFSIFYQNPEDLNSGSTVHKTNALDHWAMILPFVEVIKSPKRLMKY